MTFSALPLYRFLKLAYPLTVTVCAAVGVWRYRHLDSARRWLVWWLVVNAIASAAELPAAKFLKNSQYITMLWYPFSATLAVCILAASSANPAKRRRGFNLAAAVLLLVVGTIVSVEQFGAFARATGALHGLILLTVGAQLVLNRASAARGDLLRDPMFLTGAGLMLTGAPGAFQALVSRYFGPSEVEHRVLVASIRALMAMTGYLCMTRGLLREGGRRTMHLETVTT